MEMEHTSLPSVPKELLYFQPIGCVTKLSWQAKRPHLVVMLLLFVFQI